MAVRAENPRQTARATRACRLALGLVAALLAIAVLVGRPPLAGAEQITITSEDRITTQDKIVTWDFPYDDEWFSASAGTYNHLLARSSMGLAVSAFDPIQANPQATGMSDGNVRRYLTVAGFSSLRTEDFDENGTAGTIGTVIGSKRVGAGDDAYTLLVVAIRGIGYGDEWLSNLEIGDGERHQGFNNASQMVYDRIFGYLNREQITGRVKVWTAGFSRAGAVANLLSADLLDSGRFLPGDVFCYTFATPNTTKNPGPGEYPGVFNIVGKMDIFPQVPPVEWGYTRYGTTLYTPAQETDSAYAELKGPASEVFEQITGEPSWNNVEMNTGLSRVLYYLLALFPTSTDYANRLQQKAIATWGDTTLLSLWRDLIVIANDPVMHDDETVDEANGFLDFFAYVATNSMLNRSAFAAWNGNSNRTANIAHEHTNEVYLAWLFSTDDPTRLYTDAREYQRVVIEGDCAVSVTCPELFGQGSKTIDERGGVSVTDAGGGAPDPYMERDDHQTILVLPADADYQLVLSSSSDQQVQVYRTLMECGRSTAVGSAEQQLTLVAGQDQTYRFTALDGVDLDQSDSPGGLSLGDGRDAVSRMAQIERANVFHLDWRQLAVILITVPCVVFGAVVLLVGVAAGRLRFKRAVRQGRARGRYDAVPLTCLLAMLVGFVLEANLRWIFPDVTALEICFKLAIGLSAIWLVGHEWRRAPMESGRIALLCLAAALFSDLVMTFSFGFGMLTRLAVLGLFAWGLASFGAPNRWQWLLWAGSVVLGCSVILLVPDVAFVLRVGSTVYIALALLLVVLSLRLPKRFVFAALLLVISGGLLVVDALAAQSYLGHMMAYGSYYAAIATYADAMAHLERAHTGGALRAV